MFTPIWLVVFLCSSNLLILGIEVLRVLNTFKTNKQAEREIEELRATYRKAAL